MAGHNFPFQEIIIDYILPARSTRYRSARPGQRSQRPANREGRRPASRESRKSAPPEKIKSREAPRRKQPAKRKKEDAPVKSEISLSGQNIEDRLEYDRKEYRESFKVRED
jgi:hypothetical protein